MFELALPAVLWCLPLPFLVWLFVPRVVQAVSQALRVPFYDALVSRIGSNKQLAGRDKSWYVLGLIWILLLIAAAGPRWVGSPIPVAREGRNIMMVLDLSASMELDDMEYQGEPATRLSVVKRAARQFVMQRKGDRIGLILFGTQAYLQTPLTYDHHNVLLRLEDATAGLAGKTTSIGDALGLAVKRLQNVPARGRVIILLTDGANNSGVLTPLKAAQIAKMDSMKVYTIGLGSEGDSRGLTSLFMGLNPASDLDETTLKKIAKVTGGRYFRAKDPHSLQAIYETINQMEMVQQKESTVRPQEEYYPWILAAVCLIYLGWFVGSIVLSKLSVLRRAPLASPTSESRT